MSFGGHLSAMITSLKNNKRPKRASYFDKKISGFSKNVERKKYSQEKITDDERAKLIFKLNEQKRKQTIKVLYIIILSVLLTILVGYILNLMFFDIAKEFLD